ncbi:MAG: hypothetical protein WDZ88_00695 [Candidatus Paceibacterota bacterium]
MKTKLFLLIFILALGTGCAGIKREKQTFTEGFKTFGKTVHERSLRVRAINVYAPDGEYLGTTLVPNDRIGIFDRE